MTLCACGRFPDRSWFATDDGQVTEYHSVIGCQQTARHADVIRVSALHPPLVDWSSAPPVDTTSTPGTLSHTPRTTTTWETEQVN